MVANAHPTLRVPLWLWLGALLPLVAGPVVAMWARGAGAAVFALGALAMIYVVWRVTSGVPGVRGSGGFVWLCRVVVPLVLALVLASILSGSLAVTVAMALAAILGGGAMLWVALARDVGQAARSAE